MSRSNQLLVDVSVIIQQDARTGIQRVVRALLRQLCAMSFRNFTVVPIFATRDHGYCRARISESGVIEAEGSLIRSRQKVEAKPGDVFLGLDLAANILPYTEGEIASWRRLGVAINVVIYDLLPLHQPDWFGRKTVRNFVRWIEVVNRQADRCICISNTVAEALERELLRRGSRALPDISSIPLGVDLEATLPTHGLPEDIDDLRQWISRHRVILSVGTIEPRKGHRCVLEAMTCRWQSSPEDDVALLVVGKPGWRTEDLQIALQRHPEHGKRLIWLDRASDQLLAELYASAGGLIAASLGEGYGLPLIEARAHGLPILARDIPIFREVGGDFCNFFSDDSAPALAQTIDRWMSGSKEAKVTRHATLHTWEESAISLADRLGLEADLMKKGHSA